jgi:hypothetical protein
LPQDVPLTEGLDRTFLALAVGPAIDYQNNCSKDKKPKPHEGWKGRVARRFLEACDEKDNAHESEEHRGNVDRSLGGLLNRNAAQNECVQFFGKLFVAVLARKAVSQICRAVSTHPAAADLANSVGFLMRMIEAAHSVTVLRGFWCAV